MAVVSAALGLALLCATPTASAAPAATRTSVAAAPAWQRRDPCTTRTYTPAPGPRFNDPQGPEARQWAVLGPLVDAICSTPRGATIRIAVYSMTVARFADALIDAHRRGVNVEVLMDDHALNRLWLGLAGDLNVPYGPADRSFARACHGSCLTGETGSALHTKLYLFSTAGRAAYVSVVASANPTKAQSLVAANNSYTHAGLAGLPLYAAAVRYFDTMAAAAVDPARRDPDYDGGAADVTDLHRLWFSPRAGTDDSTDTVWQILDGVQCATTPSWSSTVRIAMFKWTVRREDITRKLIAMGQAGCRIQILWTGGGVDPLTRAALTGRPNIAIADTSVDVDGDGIADHYTHDKYWLVDGFSFGRRVRHVITGSPNFTLLALRSNCEVMERLTAPRDYAAYLADWNAQAARVPPAARHGLPSGGLTPAPLRVRPGELADS